jgi:hypothetical protein
MSDKLKYIEMRTYIPSIIVLRYKSPSINETRAELMQDSNMLRFDIHNFIYLVNFIVNEER